MPHDVFISYASENREVADLVCQVIESTPARCWMAHRDIAGGAPWADAIVKAIDSARVFVLIFSAAANDSPQVLREVTLAVTKKIPILPFRIENQLPTGSMDYLIGVTHWLDAFQGPFESHVEKLIQSIGVQLGESTRPPDLATAIAAVDTALVEFKTSPAVPSLDRVAKVIELAISFGAPIYNAGSHDNCAEIYLKTARGLIVELDKSVGPAAKDANTLAPRLSAVRDDLCQAANAHPAVTRENAKSLAWELRFAFDRTLRAELVERGIAHVDRVLAEVTRRNEPIRFRDLCEAIQTAIAYGNILYKEEDYAGIVSLHLHTTRGVLAAMPDRATENGDPDHSRLVVARGELAPFLNAGDQVRGKDAERLAWEVYEAFLRVLKLGEGESSSAAR